MSRVTMLLCMGLAMAMAGCTRRPAPDVRSERFYAAWSVAQNMAEATPLTNASARMIVRPTIGGTMVRVQLGNAVAHSPVVFSAVYLGRVDSGASLVVGSNRVLTFNGISRLTLAPGATVYSDPLVFPVKAFERLAVSLDVAHATDISTHALGLVTNYLGPGGTAGDSSGRGYRAVPALSQGVKAFPFYWVMNLDVASTDTAGTIVTLGDSITDGRCSTARDDGQGVVIPDLHQRWPDVLATRLAARPSTYPRAVSNAGIAGNQLLKPAVTGPSALDRLERDVLGRSGVTHVILFIGSNDISRSATAEQVIEGAQRIIGRVHAHGLKIIGVTMMPRGRPTKGGGRDFGAAEEQHRLAFNAWIRHQANFDGVIDFDAVMAGGGMSPAGAEMMRQPYVCDFTHPNAAGYRALGESVDLELFAPEQAGPR